MRLKRGGRVLSVRRCCGVMLDSSDDTVLFAYQDLSSRDRLELGKLPVWEVGRFGMCVSEA